MGFICERVKSEEDKKHAAEKGFTSIFGTKNFIPYKWSIDRERDIILISIGGGGPEYPEGYAIYIDGEIINMEGYEKSEGSHFENTLQEHWTITKLLVNHSFFDKKMDEEYVKKCIKEAFVARSYYGLKPEQVKAVTVDICADFENKVNGKGEII